MLQQLADKLMFLGDNTFWLRLFQSKLGLVLAPTVLGLIATLGFAPYHLWVVTLATLAAEFWLVGKMVKAKQVFVSLLSYFTALNAITLDWLNFVMEGFGGMPMVLSWAVLLIFAAYLAFFHALLGAGAFRLAQRKLRPHELERIQTEDSHTPTASTVSTTTKSHLAAPAPNTTADAKATTESQRTSASESNTTLRTVSADATATAAPATADVAADDAATPRASHDDNAYDDEDEGEAMPARGLAIFTSVSPSSTATQNANASVISSDHKYTATTAAQGTVATAQGHNNRQDAPEGDDEEVEITVADLDRIRPDLPGGMPGMFNNDLRMPILTATDGSKHLLYKQVLMLCFLPVALIIADFIVGWLFTGFPWMYLGYIAVEGPFSGYAPLLGVRGITLVLCIVAGALALAFERRFIYFPIAGMLFLVGIFTLGIRYTSDLAPLKVAAVQGNIPQAIKWDPKHTMPTIEKYLHLTMEYFGKSDLIIWPESAMPVFAQQIMPLLSDITIHAEATKSPILIGIQRYTVAEAATEDHASVASSAKTTAASAAQAEQPEMTTTSPDEVLITAKNNSAHSTHSASSANTVSADNAPASDASTVAPTTTHTHTNNAAATSLAQTTEGTEAIAEAAQPTTTTTVKPRLQVRHSYNSLLLLGQSDELADAQIYDKRKLVPFGEIVPFASITRQLGSIFNFPMSSFTAGAAKQQQMHLLERDLYFIPAICYESIFPEAIAALYDDHTNGILMVSNDSWFGPTRGPEEHLAIARMRTLEMQKPMIRVTNSGITAYIDSLGKVVSALPRDTDGVLTVDIVPAKGNTPFMVVGNIPLYILLPLLLLLGWYLRSKEEDIQEQNFQELVRP